VSDKAKFCVVVDWYDNHTNPDRIGGKYIEVGSEDDLRTALETLVGQAMVAMDGMGYANLSIKLRPVTT
jgi:hypothetical protein